MLVAVDDTWRAKAGSTVSTPGSGGADEEGTSKTKRRVPAGASLDSRLTGRGTNSARQRVPIGIAVGSRICKVPATRSTAKCVPRVSGSSLSSRLSTTVAGATPAASSGWAVPTAGASNSTRSVK